MKLEELKLMSVEQLRTIHDNLQMPYHHKSGKDKLIANIVAVTSHVVDIPRAGAAPSLVEKTHTATQELRPIKEPAQIDFPTVEDVKAALEPFEQRGMEIVLLDDKQFHIKRGVREDSGTMRQSLRNIVNCAKRLF